MLEEFAAVVVAVGRAYQGMRVAAVIAGVGQRYAGLVIELDEDHRAVDAVIKRADRIECADPGENGFVEMLPHLVEAKPGVCAR